MSTQNQSKYSMNNYNIQEPRQQQYTDYNTDSSRQQLKENWLKK